MADQDRFNSNEVDRARVDALTTPQEYGPEVGRSFVIERSSGEKVPVSVRFEKDGLYSEYTIVDPSGRKIGTASIETLTENNLRQAESSGRLHPNHEKLYYGNDKANKYKSKAYIDSMKTYGNEYKGVGKLMHQIAVEKSFQTGSEGRVQLKVGHIGSGFENFERPATSGGFHESFGYQGQDVYNPDGSLHHSGQDMHKKLAEEAWDEAQVNKKIGGNYWPPEGGIQKSPATFMSKDRPEMYLPQEVIDREKKRMDSSPILRENQATENALVEKNDDLHRQARQKQSSAVTQEEPESVEDDNENENLDPELNQNEQTVEDTDKELFSDNGTSTAFGDQPQTEAQRRLGLIDKAKRGMRRGRAVAQNTIPKGIGSALGNKQMFMGNTDKDREKVKEEVKKKARDYAKDKISKKIADKGVKAGFKKGLSKGAKGAAKEGVKRAGKQAAKVAAKGAAKVGAQVGAKAGTIAAVEGGVAAAGVASGAATFGLGFLLSLLLNIAISLGVSDAVDAAFELKDGNFKKAYFLAVRAAMKVLMFVILLLTIVSVFSVAGIFIAVPLLLYLNIYMALGFAFRKIPHFQGLVWWEILIILAMDVMAFLILMVFLGALGWYLCGEGSIPGFVMGAIASVYDWWNKSTAGSVAADFCKYINTAASVPPVQ